MRDSRISFLPKTTVNSNATLNSSAVNLLDDYVGDHLLPTGEYGIGVRVVVGDITGSTYELNIKVQESADNSTWYDLSSWDEIDPPTDKKGDKIVLEKRLRPNRKYIRLAVVSTNISGESCSVRADIVDGATCGNTIRFA